MHKYLEHFDNPSNTAPTTIIDPDWPSETDPTVRAAQDERYFAFDYGPATVIAIDVNNQSPNGSSNDTNFNILGENDPDGGFAPDWAPGSRQYQWLEEQLQRAQARNPFIFSFTGITRPSPRVHMRCHQASTINPAFHAAAR